MLVSVHNSSILRLMIWFYKRVWTKDIQKKFKRNARDFPRIFRLLSLWFPWNKCGLWGGLYLNFAITTWILSLRWNVETEAISLPATLVFGLLRYARNDKSQEGHEAQRLSPWQFTLRSRWQLVVGWLHFIRDDNPEIVITSRAECTAW